MTSDDEGHLSIAGRPLTGDPLAGNLKPGADIGILGIQLETRRRNRLNGHIEAVGDNGFVLAVDQAFGNCPRYIQTREVGVDAGIDAPTTARPVTRADRFDAPTREIIAKADTLFIATATGDRRSGGAGSEYARPRNAPDARPRIVPDARPRNANEGADASHRGGKPGFVRIVDDRTLVFPDFSGNNHFNTVGNIEINPKAGFLFTDFETGDVVYMTGAAEIIWNGEEVEAFEGAERLIRFSAEKVVRVERSLPLSFTFGEYSPVLERTGSWAPRTTSH
jgi:predicted pyridoxine 5'-phosphate oxidase superfamily flavin-nucleotide-binding protein